MADTYGIRLHFDRQSYFLGRGLDQDQADDLAHDIQTALDDLGTRLSVYAEKEQNA